MRFRSYIKNFPDLLQKLIPKSIDLSTVDIWQQDESRFGQQGSLTRIWAPTGTRPRKVRQRQFISTYLYGSACAATGETFGLVLPYTNTNAMHLYLKEFSKQIKDGKHVALIVDNAGWHIAHALNVPDNITLIPLPSYSSELNAMEQVWQWMKEHYLSNISFKDYDEIVDKVCECWNMFCSKIEVVKSLCLRSWQKTP